MVLRPETLPHTLAIGAHVFAAYRDAPRASGHKAAIVDVLREDSTLSVSPVCSVRPRDLFGDILLTV
jgi:hypothetical protein